MADTDMFGAKHTEVSSVARASEAVFRMDDIAMPAMQIQIQYQEQLQLQPVYNGYTIVMAQQPQGKIQIGAVLNKDLNDFLDSHGNVEAMATGDPIDIEMDSGATQYTESEEMSVEPGALVTCRNVKIVSMGIQTEIKGVLVNTNVQLQALNIDKPDLGSYGPTPTPTA